MQQEVYYWLIFLCRGDQPQYHGFAWNTFNPMQVYHLQCVDLLFGAIVDGCDVYVEKAVVFRVLGGHILWGQHLCIHTFFPCMSLFCNPISDLYQHIYTIIILANVVILFEYRISVICVLFTNIFYTKSVHYQTCSSPGRAVRSHSLVCSENSLLIVGKGPIHDKEF